eukprot:NODE_1398_length_451_cov_228.080247_g1388_i0.p1 GENE.NODE_1398_length_451_cov_228.080247_g1388_i0~~NODE_1398_length_451_cov_228.080247_g1388_i0.p1  ORF type:complete len:102 (+),score=40.75 NODE_1398_length_451_cov_228.080247_g1388_i0:40-306(+)
MYLRYDSYADPESAVLDAFFPDEVSDEAKELNCDGVDVMPMKGDLDPSTVTSAKVRTLSAHHFGSSNAGLCLKVCPKNFFVDYVDPSN